MASTMDEEELIIAVSHMKLAGAATVTSVHAALQDEGLSVDISQVKKAEWKAVKRAVRARAVPAAAPQLPLSPPQLPLSAPPVAAPPWDERLRGSYEAVGAHSSPHVSWAAAATGLTRDLAAVSGRHHRCLCLSL